MTEEKKRSKLSRKVVDLKLIKALKIMRKDMAEFIPSGSMTLVESDHEQFICSFEEPD